MFVLSIIWLHVLILTQHIHLSFLVYGKFRLRVLYSNCLFIYSINSCLSYLVMFIYSLVYV